MNINSFYPTSSEGYSVEKDTNSQVNQFILWSRFCKLIGNMPFSDDLKERIKTRVDYDFKTKKVEQFIAQPCVATLVRCVEGNGGGGVISKQVSKFTTDGQHFCSVFTERKKVSVKPQRKAITTYKSNNFIVSFAKNYKP